MLTKLSTLYKTTSILLKANIVAGRPTNFIRMASSLIKDKAFVNGEWISAKSGATYNVTNPATGEVVGSVPDMGVADTEDAIQKAYKAYQTFKKTTAKERSEKLKKAYKLMMENKEELARIITLENGKPLAEANGEIMYGAGFCEWFAEEGRRVQGHVVASPFPTKKIFTLKQPIGVCAMITPWNFPNAMITRKACAAIAAGCTVVLKPAEDTPLSALAICEIFEQAGIPKGVFNVVTCDRGNAPSVGKLLCESPLVSLISFTGSSAVGKILMKQSADTVKKCSMELGGNAPFIVFDSADLDLAVKGAMSSKFRCTGQTCVCANRFLIQEGIYEKFVARLAEAMDKELKVGNGLTQGTTQGPLINKRAADKVATFVEDAKSKGANVVRGGQRSDVGESFYEPTLLSNVTSGMLVSKEEIFGPVAGVAKFKSEEEAIALANGTSAGLAGYLYTGDCAQQWRVAEALEYGIVGVNEGLFSTPEAPFGGFKESGLGREGGIGFGIEEYLEVKYMCLGGM
ncbi:succinate-semialdehyde dehydrogenase, mitochondrial-like [Mya arenaria]|uniref:succinate-semialdehyde dehydrogenase, mitochondrial-like n=1 Tax=Mya arenaria TaxID=6604 RepID=UPI0022E3E2CC|nr:succinate-semialdehyde dehydrogenase, mitochondrial-like [Mya arenaria]XP_052779980.1 succinate-semialdehyde dehydrogenase, mitochondrial-like [Mya arenaria]XP_052779981.1 succinate-semialdehyde dehydrogenase, mitochondrial-like [Mya arenaria]XP_052779982.1 succinate-semialdehyde dehydrogenase, mitochondrial-like [Mya arenaria]